jgi:hypothetical protein
MMNRQFTQARQLSQARRRIFFNQQREKKIAATIPVARP